MNAHTIIVVLLGILMAGVAVFIMTVIAERQETGVWQWPKFR